MKSFSRVFRAWVPFAVVTASLILLVFVAVQQSYRQGANDPQIQMAEDTAAIMASGGFAQEQIPALSVDMAKSLSTFTIIADTNGKLVAGSGQLNGSVPVPPIGALEAAKNNTGNGGQTGENRITWQPQKGVRIAAVIAYYGGSKPGYVIVGRNLREVENRENDLNTLAVVGFIGISIITFSALGVTAGRIRSKKNAQAAFEKIG